MAYIEPRDAHAIINCHQSRTEYDKEGKPYTVPAYKHQSYPKMLYPVKGGRPIVVTSAEEETNQLATKNFLPNIPSGHLITPDGQVMTEAKWEKLKEQMDQVVRR